MGKGPKKSAPARRPRKIRQRNSAKARRPPAIKRAAFQSKRRGTTFIVGVGASAGGLDALKELVSHVSFDSLALVIAQHLSPHHESILTELLSKSSPIKVQTIRDGMRVESAHVYVLPPSADLAILHGTLHLLPAPTKSGSLRLPIDRFFRSLAEDQGARAIGVVLSGTGSDGTEGLKAIKQAGGITFAQSPASAKFTGMPRSAIESGWADASLSPAEIGDELMRIGRHPYLARGVRGSGLNPDQVNKLLLMIRDGFGTDLSFYKRPTIERRIERQLALHKIDRLEEYLKFVQLHPAELARLYKDILINVTSFFRDPEVFETLKTRIFPKLMEGKSLGSAIRVWVPGCSTGEEVYSLAIALLEFLGDRAKDYRIQLFATDIDEATLQVARRGVYPQSITLDVSNERLQRFFVGRNTDFQIARRIRDMVVFSVQNLTKDAPFSRLDLVSCRNLLIYLQPTLQRRVMQILHYSLLPGRFLLLGTSETVGESIDLFSLLDRAHKVYVAKRVVAPASLDALELTPEKVRPIPPTSLPLRSGMSITAAADRKVLEIYGPPGVIVNEDLTVLHFRGQTGPFVSPSPGTASLNLLRLARPELVVDLRRLMKAALGGQQRREALSQVLQDGMSRPVRIEVVPMAEPESKERYFLILFHEIGSDLKNAEPTASLQDPTSEQSPWERRSHDLEQELTLTKEYLQTTVEELESANEELKSSNEELQSSNEELQSTNEELETSKEELQSSNEELTTVNDELQNRMSELQEIHEDLQVVLQWADSAVVIIGTDLRIRRFTTAARSLFNLHPADLGRSISLLNGFMPAERIEQICAEVMERAMPLAREIVGVDGHRYTMRVAPYRGQEESVTGAVVLLSQAGLAGASKLSWGMERYVSGMIAEDGIPRVVLDDAMNILWTNAEFAKTFSAQDGIGRSLTEALRGPSAAKLVSGLKAATLGLEVPPMQITAGKRVFEVECTRLPAIEGATGLLLLAFDDAGQPRRPGGAAPNSRAAREVASAPDGS